MVLDTPSKNNTTLLTPEQFEAGIAGLTHATYRSSLGDKKLKKGTSTVDDREFIYNQLGTFFMKGLRNYKGFRNKTIRCPVPDGWSLPRGWKR
jgi:hypothetical protein